jgi:hypothetical protein
VESYVKFMKHSTAPGLEMVEVGTLTVHADGSYELTGDLSEDILSVPIRHGDSLNGRILFTENPHLWVAHCARAFRTPYLVPTDITIQ